MAGLVVSASAGVLGSLLSKLSLLLSHLYKKRKGVRKDIELLSNELTNINAAVERLADMEKLDGQTKVWRDKVREMGYDIEDCIDIFINQLGQEDDKDGLFHKIARKFRELRKHYQLANMIQDIKARVEEQSKIRDRYRIDESISTSRVVMEVDPRLPALFEDVKRLVGIDGPRDEITKLLIGECEQLKVVSIVGFGGLGKTTLANQVHTEIGNKFDYSAFVSVSRTPDFSRILKDILYQAKYPGKVLEDDVQNLMKILKAHLTNKSYFIVIDDLWRIQDWRTIIEPVFVENNNRSRVMTTTRIQDIGIACCLPTQGHVYQMQPLNELHSRRLFFKRLFGTEDGCPQQFRDISNDMLRKCKGVPLAITSIASLLANRMDVETWEKIHNSLGYQLDTNPTMEWMRHVLILSYNDLSYELKTCLLYLGMYPEDYLIPKEDLLRKWMGEGFVREKHGLDLEEAAENCFNELINRSMIQPCFDEYGFGFGFGEVWACQVHDLMLDLIISKCKEENFITIIDKKYPMNRASQVRRISHQFHDKDMPLIAESMNASTIRSYISFRVADCMPLLSKFELLRVLHMENNKSSGSLVCLDLSAINDLFRLRYLRVLGYRYELPKKFAKLKHLMTLRLWQPDVIYHCSSEQLLDFSSLPSLRHLMLPERATIKNGLSKLCNLRDLSCFDIGINSIECIRNLGELTNLTNLDVTYDNSFKADGTENNPKVTILAASLNKLGNSNLRHFVFRVRSAPSPSAQFWSNCLTRPRHLQRLVLHGVAMPKLPNWVAHAGRLAHAVLCVQELQSDDFQVLGQLPCLINLQLRANTIPENNIIIYPNTFQSLERFIFHCDDELPRVTFEPAAMSRLQRLRIINGLVNRRQAATQLQEGCQVGGIEHLASLEEISLTIAAKCGQRSKCRDAISRHPKSQAMKIYVSGSEYDENGKFVGVFCFRD